jgi:predicted branched-subunit amino acid permease
LAVLALLTLTLPMLRDRASRVAALAACCVALPAQALPRGLPVLATMLVAMAAGLLIERRGAAPCRLTRLSRPGWRWPCWWGSRC